MLNHEIRNDCKSVERWFTRDAIIRKKTRRFDDTKQSRSKSLRRPWSCDTEVPLLYISHNWMKRRPEKNNGLLTWFSFWYNTPNLKLEDTLCSSKSLISIGALRMRNFKSFMHIKVNPFVMVKNYLEVADCVKLWDGHFVTQHLESRWVLFYFFSPLPETRSSTSSIRRTLEAQITFKRGQM